MVSLLLASQLVDAPAMAQTPAATCAAASVSARGEPASLRLLALTKARGNWRARVRVTPGMGAAYADWGAAAEQVERCIENTGSIVCTVSAIPCRR